MRKIVFFAFSLLFALPSMAQTSLEEIKADPLKAGGYYYTYQGPQKAQTRAPRGYKAFYVSHFGRHGSRWHTGKEAYTIPLKALQAGDSAGVLTPLGKDVLTRMDTIWADAKGRIGSLTPLGVSQHRGIAERMVRSFPKAFGRGAKVEASSTQSERVILSMCAFCDRMEELRPHLMIPKTADSRDGRHLSKRSRAFYKFEDRMFEQPDYPHLYRGSIGPDRLLCSLFADTTVLAGFDKQQVYEHFFEVAMILQDSMPEMSLCDIFTVEELFDIWQMRNSDFYVRFGSAPSAGDTVANSAAYTIEHIIDKADEYIGNGWKGATLRFSHDSFLTPLATALELDGCRGKETDPSQYYKAWANFNITPMAGNIQVVFYKNRKSDILVKFMLNENEVGIPVATDRYPYYHWADVRAYYYDKYLKEIKK